MIPLSTDNIYGASLSTESTGFERPELGYYVKQYYKDSDGWHWRFKKAETTGYLYKFILNRSKDKNDWAYCIEPDKHLATNYESNNLHTYWSAIPSSQRDGMELAIKFGYQNNVCTVPGFGTSNANAQYVATQILVWEFKEGVRKNPLSERKSVYNSSNELRIPANTYYNAVKDKLPEKYYDKILNTLQSYYKGASFSYKSKAEAKENVITLHFNQDKQRWETTLTDENHSGLYGDDIEAALGDDFEVSRSAGSNKYKIYTTKPINDIKTISIKNYRSDLTKNRKNEGRLIWSNDSTIHQPLMTGSDIGIDLYMCFATSDVGTLNLKKVTEGAPDESNIDLSQFSFEIKNNLNGNVINANTDHEGVFSVILPEGTYTISEKLEQNDLKKYWEQPEPQTIEIKNNQTKKVIFKNQWKKGSIKIVKTSDDGKVGNISFKVTGPDNYEKIVTTRADETNKAEIYLTDLKVGVYNIEEIVPEGYFPQNIVSVDLRTKDVAPSKTVKFHNVSYAGGIRVVKKDSETGSLVKQAGFEFKIYDKGKGKYLINELTGDDIFTTGDSGYTPYAKLLQGGTFVITEIGIPDGSGYVMDAKEKTISVSDDDVQSNKTYTIEMKNSPQKGKIRVIKHGNQFVSVDCVEEFKIPKFEDHVLENAIFEVYAKEDIHLNDGTIKFKKDDLVEQIVTDSTGVAETSELPLGTYSIREVKSPNGFIIDDKTDLEIRIEPKGNEKVLQFECNYSNTNQKVRLHVNKIMEDDEENGLGNAEIKEVVFGLFAAESMVALDGSTIEKNDLIKTLSLYEEGDCAFDVELPEGKYYVKEIKTDEHYLLDHHIYDFEVSFDDDMENEFIDIYIQEGQPIVNYIKYKDIEIEKADLETGELLDGAEFGIWKKDESEFNRENAIEIKTTVNGKIVFRDLIVGEYVIKELNAPTGYEIFDSIIETVVENNNERVEVKVDNAMIKGNLRLKKIDTETGQLLSGAEFAIYDQEGNLFSKGKTDKNGIWFVENIPYGIYSCVELAAPEGYQNSLEKHIVEIDEQDELIELEISNEKVKSTELEKAESVPTGDNDNLMFWGSMLVLAACMKRYLNFKIQ